MSESNNIFPFGPAWEKNEKLSEDKLMAYLEGRLSPEEQHNVELWLAKEGMESDALEGLHNIAADETKHTISRLNNQLHKSLTNKKRNRRALKTDQYTWVAIAIIFILAVLAYIVIRKAI